jgi:hypothetical protein
VRNCACDGEAAADAAHREAAAREAAEAAVDAVLAGLGLDVQFAEGKAVLPTVRAAPEERLYLVLEVSWSISWECEE